MTFVWSEFGRRPEENDSDGTDHGAAGVGFLIGSKATGQTIGEFPTLDSTGLDNYGNVRATSDFRGVYCSVLEDWLNTDAAMVIPGADTLPRYPVVQTELSRDAPRRASRLLLAVAGARGAARWRRCAGAPGCRPRDGATRAPARRHARVAAGTRAPRRRAARAQARPAPRQLRTRARLAEARRPVRRSAPRTPRDARQPRPRHARPPGPERRHPPAPPPPTCGTATGAREGEWYLKPSRTTLCCRPGHDRGAELRPGPARHAPSARERARRSPPGPAHARQSRAAVLAGKVTLTPGALHALLLADRRHAARHAGESHAAAGMTATLTVIAP